MGAQDRPQCHFDIEINREPGERETGFVLGLGRSPGEGEGSVLVDPPPSLFGSG